MLLESWHQRIIALKETFQEIIIFHVYREFNTKAYVLSKEALSLGKGLLLVHHFFHGSLC